jgi:tetratricopeptide (TPR) repeat protein
MRTYVNAAGFIRAFSGVSLAMVAASAVGTGGCAKIGQVKAQRAFKEANQDYQQQDYKKAAEAYEEALQANADLIRAYFYLGNSYDNQFRPGPRGEPADDAFLEKAVKNYQLAADKLATSSDPDDKKLARLSLEYLVAAYGTDKLNDPAKAEPIVQKMIQLEPSDPTNYFQLAKIYEDAGAYEEAEKVYQQAKNAKPNDPTVYTTLAGFYNRQGEFDKTIAALEERATKEPNNPEAHHTIASFYWDEATRDARLSDKQKVDYVQKGIQADDKALQLKPDYVDALVFKGLLLRLQENLEKDPGKQQALIKQATELHDKAEGIRKKKTAQ